MIQNVILTTAFGRTWTFRIPDQHY